MSDTTILNDQARGGAPDRARRGSSVALRGGERQPFAQKFYRHDQHEGDRIGLTDGGLKAEVLTADSVPVDEESLAREKARARKLFGQLISGQSRPEHLTSTRPGS